jgi:hypothetical protein
MIGKFVHFPVFIISFLIGIIFVFLASPDNKTVHVYPTPDNVDKIQYIDHAENCYAFKSQKISCPQEKHAIKTIPLQTPHK